MAGIFSLELQQKCYWHIKNWWFFKSHKIKLVHVFIILKLIATLMKIVIWEIPSTTVSSIRNVNFHFNICIVQPELMIFVKIQENSLIGLFQVLNNSVFTYQSSNKLLAMPPPGRYSDPSGSSNDGLPSSGIHFKTSCVNLSLFSASKSGVEMYLNWGLKRNYCLYKICKSFQILCFVGLSWN